MSIKDYIWLHINECANLFDSWFYFLLLPDGQEVLVNGSQETAASQVGIFSKGNFRNNEQCAVIMLFYYYFHYSDVQNRVTCSESPLNPAALRERYFVLLLSFTQFCNKDNYSLLWHLFPWQCEFSFKKKKLTILKQHNCICCQTLFKKSLPNAPYMEYLSSWCPLTHNYTVVLSMN